MMTRLHVFFGAAAVVGCTAAMAACSSEAPPAPGVKDGGGDPGGGTPDAGNGTHADGGGMHMDDGGNPDAGAPVACPTGTNCPPGATCTGDGMCSTGKCFQGGQRAYCTKACAQANAATDCPNPPYQGICNNQGYCRM